MCVCVCVRVCVCVCVCEVIAHVLCVTCPSQWTRHMCTNTYSPHILFSSCCTNSLQTEKYDFILHTNASMKNEKQLFDSNWQMCLFVSLSSDETPMKHAGGQRSHVAQSNLTVTSSVWDSCSLEPCALVASCSCSCCCVSARVWFSCCLIVLARCWHRVLKRNHVKTKSYFKKEFSSCDKVIS